MPKLDGIEFKTLFGKKVDKENDNVFFNDEEHSYLDKNDGSKYISVTTLLHEYQNAFNESFFSKYKALEALSDADKFSWVKQGLLNTQIWKPELVEKLGIDQSEFDNKVEEILQSWHSNRDEACQHGSYVHNLLETSFYGKTEFDLSQYGLPQVCGNYTCDKGNYKLDLDNGIYPEFLMSWISPEGVRLAGQADLICKSGNDIDILDWKGLDINTPILTTNGWKTMGTLNYGDKVFDKDGNETNILHISEEHRNPCYKIIFDNGDELIADEDHRWLIAFMVKHGSKKNYHCGPEEKVMTTKELFTHLSKIKNRNSYNIPRIYNAKPLNTNKIKLPIDPYVLGVWLGDGSKTCGIITNVRNELWEEIKKRGYTISENLSKEDRAEMRTVYNLRHELSKLNLLNNKHIPDIYFKASYEQRLDLLRGLMDTDGFLHKKRKRFVMETSQEWQVKQFAQLLASLGLKSTIFNTVNKLNGKEFPGWMCCWTSKNFNPFLIRNQKEFEELEIIKDNNSYRNILNIVPVDTVITKCIEVDSSTHTYLAGEHLIVTHNTNKEIKRRSFYNSSKKSNVKLKYPLNNLEDCNYNLYMLQLSMYAYMLQQLNPDFNIRSLTIVHIQRDGSIKEYPVEYKKDEVEKVIKHYAKQQKIKCELERDKPFIM